MHAGPHAGSVLTENVCILQLLLIVDVDCATACCHNHHAAALSGSKSALIAGIDIKHVKKGVAFWKWGGVHSEPYCWAWHM